ncbi:YqaA family protein [Microvirga aerophila]|uniref:Membrane protein n=1 Tax=Microvirga aerophila TaxID=670291 RepID=A0A512BRB4_9HYPH|nr:YqaA family protein [Microvirga aerophila]GEO14546.1 membrane protein [Microvirga aerophila]
MPHLAEYGALFAAAFLSATILPAQSEAVLFGMLVSERYSEWLLIAVASAGNTAGSVMNWFLGRFLAHFEGRRWFPIKREQMARAEGWYHRYGRWTLLMSWVPVIGDPLTVVAGVLREPLPVFIALVAVAKTARYLIVGGASLGWM